MRLFRSSLFCIPLLVAFATPSIASNTEKQQLTDTIEMKIDEVKKIISSREWMPADTASYNRLIELIDYIESQPIDSVIYGLKKDLDNSKPLVMPKKNQRNRKLRNIQGYVSD